MMIFKNESLTPLLQYLTRKPLILRSWRVKIMFHINVFLLTSSLCSSQYSSQQSIMTIIYLHGCVVWGCLR